MPLGDGARKFAKIQKFKNRKKIKNGGCSQIQKTQKRRLLSENSKIQKPQKRKNGDCSQKIPEFKNSKTTKTQKRWLLSENSKIQTRRRMARERRGAGSSLVSMETQYYKQYMKDVL